MIGNLSEVSSSTFFHMKKKIKLYGDNHLYYNNKYLEEGFRKKSG